MAGDTRSGTYAQVFRVVEFRALWCSVVLSRGGGELARVALALLTFQRTGSPAVTALVYALTSLPAIVGGSFLGVLADRYPRRTVLTVCAYLRAILVLFVAIPGIPLPVLCALVFVIQAIDAPAKAAQMALLPDILNSSLYPLGVAAVALTNQIVSLVAFPVGGVLVAITGPNNALLVTAGAFAGMGLIARLGLQHRPAAQSEGAGRGSGFRGGWQLIMGSPPLRNLIAAAMLAGFYVTPEALAAPYAASLGMGSAQVGLLLAAIPVGNVLGVFLYTRWVPSEARLRWLGPLAVVSSLPLVFSALHPGFVVSMILWVLVGMLSAYQVTANTEFVRIVPKDRRGQALGLASALLISSQGLGMLLGGLLADRVGVAEAIAVFGAVGCLVGLFPAIGWHRARRGLTSSEPSTVAD
ncbi:MFS transporter [Nonomuraea maritima]|uniref:MFS transporter n=1 Tax=Nonomuraea maritima TaxID=683260 RepID=UPI00371EE835